MPQSRYHIVLLFMYFLIDDSWTDNRNTIQCDPEQIERIVQMIQVYLYMLYIATDGFRDQRLLRQWSENTNTQSQCNINRLQNLFVYVTISIESPNGFKNIPTH